MRPSSRYARDYIGERDVLLSPTTGLINQLQRLENEEEKSRLMFPAVLIDTRGLVSQPSRDSIR